jgi:hypothetical protein
MNFDRVNALSLVPIIGTGALSANKKTPRERMCYPATAHLKLVLNTSVPLPVRIVSQALNAGQYPISSEVNA